MAIVGVGVDAIEIARANPDVVSFPSVDQSALWFGSVGPVSNQHFIQLANTLAARLLVLNARTPAERAELVQKLSSDVIEAFKCGLLDRDEAREELKARGEELRVYMKV